MHRWGELREKRYAVSGKIAVILIAILAAVAVITVQHFLGGLNNGSKIAPATPVTSRHYNVTASAVIASAVARNPAGYVARSPEKQLSARENGVEDAGFVIFEKQGYTANVTILVFDTQGSAQAYLESIRSNIQPLAGYSDITPTFDSYTDFGECYGYGQDYFGQSVADGLCNNGNVFIQVHLASLVSPLSSLQADASDLMGAAYLSVG